VVEQVPHRLWSVDQSLRLCVRWVANDQLLVFLDKISVLKGPDLIAVGERVCAKPTEREARNSDPERVKQPVSSTLSGLDHMTG